MTVLINWALQPVGIISLFLLIAALCALWPLRHYRALRGLSILSLVTLWAFSAPIVVNTAVQLLENSRQNPALCASTQTTLPIVVLGGGLDMYVESASPYEILNQDSLRRVHRAADIATDDSQFFVLGGGRHDRNLAELMTAILLHRGTDETRIVKETTSLSTYENAQALSRLAHPDKMPAIVLVTSALHIPRAAAVFERIGYTVCHEAADSQYSRPALPVALLPYLSGLKKSTMVWHELLAWAAYRINAYV